MSNLSRRLKPNPAGSRGQWEQPRARTSNAEFFERVFGSRQQLARFQHVASHNSLANFVFHGLYEEEGASRNRGKTMRYLKYAALAGVLLFAAASAEAQVRVGVGIGVGPLAVGPEPVCAYGYYSYYPYACAPYGYWAPSYFVNGVFVGVGPWYHAHGHGAYWGPRGYYGRGDYGHPYYGHPGWHGRPVYGGPAHGYAHSNVHGGGFHGGASAAFHGGHGGGHR